MEFNQSQRYVNYIYQFSVSLYLFIILYSAVVGERSSIGIGKDKMLLVYLYYH